MYWEPTLFGSPVTDPVGSSMSTSRLIPLGDWGVTLSEVRITLNFWSLASVMLKQS